MIHSILPNILVLFIRLVAQDWHKRNRIQFNVFLVLRYVACSINVSHCFIKVANKVGRLWQ